MKLFFTFLLPALLLLPAVSAAEGNDDDASMSTLKSALVKEHPGIDITRISKTPIEGLYEVVVGSNVVYMDKSARYMLQGDLVDRKKRTNYTEQARSSLRRGMLKDLGEENMLVYKPERTEHTLTIVTDIDCPYCRRLHKEMDQYLENGIKVRYIFMPLKGDQDFATTVSVWCSDNPNKALDTAKAGGSVKQKTCDNPIKQHLALARNLGVRGTPAIILEDGQMLPGYVPVDRLVQELNKP